VFLISAIEIKHTLIQRLRIASMRYLEEVAQGDRPIPHVAHVGVFLWHFMLPANHKLRVQVELVIDKMFS